MRTTVTIDDEMMAVAHRLTGITEKSAVIRAALKALIERESARRLALLGGSDPDAIAAPRRRIGVMVLVDTSVWIDHIRFSEPELKRLLLTDRVLGHPMLSVELALGNFKRRMEVLEEIGSLPKAVAATDEEVLRFVETKKLFGRGVGYVDAHFLAAVQLTPNALLWTRDRHLHQAAQELSLAFTQAQPN